MNAYFNDTTLKPLSQENMLYLPDLKKVWEEFKRRTNGAARSMFSLSFDQCDKLSELASEVAQSGKRDLQDFFFHTICPGFRQEMEQAKDSDVNNKFDNSEYKVKISPEEEIPCPILGWAMLNQGVAFGLASSSFWNRQSPVVDLIVYEYDLGQDDIVRLPETVSVCCVTRKEHLSSIEYHGLGEDDEVDEICDPPYIVNRRLKGKIVVLGAESVNELLRVVAELGFDFDRFDFIPYDRLTNYDCSRWKDSRDIAVIMCGPVPHSGAGMGDANNLYNALRKGEGFPPVVPLQESTGKLKVTKNSFREGLLKLMNEKTIAKNYERSLPC